MDDQISESREKVRQQFKYSPYPRRPLEQFPKDDYNWLFIHNLVTPYYLKNQKVIETKGKFILDAGCGTGYKALALAAANPGAKIVGVDLSEEAVELAKKRLCYHGFKDAEFQAMALEDLPNLGMEFDYINCDEVLYLLPDLVAGLRAMKSVLKPDGIIRSNLHSALERSYFYRAQEGFRMMGLMDKNPRESEVELCREMMSAFNDNVRIKEKTWNPERAYKDQEWILSNYLFLEDKGYTIPEVFACLKDANLEMISMVKWREWELQELFQEPNKLPRLLAMCLPQMSLEELHLFELWHPIHRLLDFWCGYPQEERSLTPVARWTEEDWQKAVVQLHPQLRTPQVREDAIACIRKRSSFEISRYISTSTLSPIWIEPVMTTCLLSLWEGSQPVSTLVESCLKIAPLQLPTLEPAREATAFQEVTECLRKLEGCLYVLLEQSP